MNQYRSLLVLCGLVGVSAFAQPTGSKFVAVVPCRVVDTRLAGPSGGVIAAGNSRTFSVIGSNCGIPASASAYSLNVTVVPSGPLAFLTAWPTGQSQPFVSTLNSFEGRIVANAAIIPAGNAGSVNIYVTNDANVIVDVNGYFDSQNANALGFFTVTPCRVSDTRNAAGPFGGPSITAGSTRGYGIPNSACGVPSQAAAYSLNATVVPSGALPFLTLWPASQPQPLVSTLNSFDGRIVANAAIVPAGFAGGINAFVSGNTDLILDINGYFGGGSGPVLSFFPITPCRVADTRMTVGTFGGPSLGAGAPRAFPIPQSGCGVPTNARAYALNITAVPKGILQFLTIWPGDQTRPLVSTLNSFQGSVVANAAIVPASATDGSVNVFTSESSDVLIDINGYFANTAPAPAYTLAVSPTTGFVNPGGSTTYQVTLTSQNNFTGNVSLDVTNPPTGVMPQFSPNPVTVPAQGSGGSTLTLTSNGSAALTTSSITLQASSQGFPTLSQNISLTVNAAAPNALVTINNFAFSPTPVTVKAGANVIWTNQQTGVSHTVTSDGGAFGSGVIATGLTFTTMPTTPGTYTYHCDIHRFMLGTVVVTP